MKIKGLLITLLASVFIFTACSVNDTGDEGDQQPPATVYHLYINEFMASNDNAYADENGEYDDWIELYNAGDKEINIAGMYLSDNPDDATKWQIPTGSDKTKIPAGGFLVLWADGQTDQGVLHLPFKLSSGGEAIVVTASDGETTIDQHIYGPQTTDISEGRDPDGSDNWVKFSVPTPGASNTGTVATFPPTIANIVVTPDTVSASDAVTVTATVTDEDGDLQTVKIIYGADLSAGTEKDMTANGDTYTADLGTFPDGSTIYFYIKATDAAAHVALSDTLSFQVGFVAPVLYINEFMASNDTTYLDPTTNDYPDWIEIYNPNSTPIDIGGYYITDGLDDLTTWQIPTTAPDSTTIPAGGFLLLLADKKPEAGVLHVNIKLSGSGEQIGLTAPNGTTIIDSLTFGQQTTDVSEGREPDGSDNWVFFTNPTPGASNN